MTEAEWRTCANPCRMVQLIAKRISDRKLRLFLCACCRAIWPSLRDERSRKVVEVAEHYADGAATSDDRLAATVAAAHVHYPEGPQAARNAARLAWAAGRGLVLRSAADAVGQKDDGRCDLLRDIFNPFCHSAIDPSWLRWNDGCVRKIAQAIHDERRFHEMPILADALEDAGCDDEAILRHCRDPGEHVRGCWVIDLLLGKK